MAAGFDNMAVSETRATGHAGKAKPALEKAAATFRAATLRARQKRNAMR